MEAWVWKVWLTPVLSVKCEIKSLVEIQIYFMSFCLQGITESNQGIILKLNLDNHGVNKIYHIDLLTEWWSEAFS